MHSYSENAGAWGVKQNLSGSFAEKDKALGLDKSATLYAYYKLLEKKIIWHTTITMQSLPIKYTP
ncbi:MAG: hypothetical protein ACP5MC_03460 [Candidatus Micrarchaeia archaeon]